jgi:hypothetical protein
MLHYGLKHIHQARCFRLHKVVNMCCLRLHSSRQTGRLTSRQLCEDLEKDIDEAVLSALRFVPLLFIHFQTLSLFPSLVSCLATSRPNSKSFSEKAQQPSFVYDPLSSSEVIRILSFDNGPDLKCKLREVRLGSE